MSKSLYASITNCSNIISVGVSESHEASFTTAQIECESTSLTVGDSVVIDIGYTTDHEVIFRGIVKNVEFQRPENTYVITAQDFLVRAVDYFIASSDPENPLTYSNISAEDLVETLLNLAGISSFSYDATSFTFGVANEFEVNLVSSYDFSRQVADILAWHLYARRDGIVYFIDRLPNVMDGSTYTGKVDSTSIAVLTDAEILNFNYGIDEKDLRNRVVVYGRNGISAEASASSPYLPAGFYKTVVLATQLIDSVSNAQRAANFNLVRLNKISEFLSITIEGDSTIETRKTLTVNSTELGLPSALWYIYTAEHQWSESGYIVNIQLRK